MSAVVSDRSSTVDEPGVTHRCFVRALVAGTLLTLCPVGRADSFFRPPAGELVGLSRNEVVAALGDPSSFAASNNQEILVYPSGRIDLTAGKVVSADEGVRKEFQKRTRPTLASSAKAPAPAPSSKPSTPMSARVQTPRSAATSDPGNVIATAARTGLEPFFGMVGVLAACVVVIGSLRILTLRRGRQRVWAEAQRTPDSGQPAPRTRHFVAPDDTRPWHDYENNEPLTGDPAAITPLTSHDRLAPQTSVGSGWSLGLLRALEWKRFEDLTAAYFGEVGFITKTTGLGADGGVDVKLYRPEEMKPETLVQCKAWAPCQPVGVKAIRELYGVMAADGVARGVFITTSTFTDEALAFARGKALDLIAGEKFLDRILALSAEAQARLLARATEGDYTTPSCPRCGTKMVLRTAAKGRNTGDRFWGCRRYPRCREKLQVRTN